MRVVATGVGFAVIFNDVEDKTALIHNLQNMDDDKLILLLSDDSVPQDKAIAEIVALRALFKK